jgi:endonuclease III
MKDSKQYSEKIRKLFRSLKRRHEKVTTPEYDDPLEALVYGIISEHTDLSSSKTIARQMKSYFVDLNDMRVSRTEEISDILGSSLEHQKKTAITLRQALNSVFRKYDVVSLQAFDQMGKRQAKKVLDKLEGASPFSVNYCFLTAMGGHAIPLTRKMFEYLRANDLVHPESSDEEIAGFLERQISVASAYKFYWLLRQESEGHSGGRGKKTTGKTKKKTTKRTRARKKATTKRTKSRKA